MNMDGRAPSRCLWRLPFCSGKIVYIPVYLTPLFRFHLTPLFRTFDPPKC
jgi:hypothetical protein